MEDDQLDCGNQSGGPAAPRRRRHRRVVRPGKERFDVDGTEEDPQDRVCKQVALTRKIEGFWASCRLTGGSSLMSAATDCRS